MARLDDYRGMVEVIERNGEDFRVRCSYDSRLIQVAHYRNQVGIVRYLT